jgi:hypothetical protein
MLGAATFSGCKRNMHSVIENEPRFVGIVQSSTDEYVLVELNEDDPLHDNYATLQVSLNVELKDSYLSFSTGDEIVVYYDGNITDDKVETVYAITLQTQFAGMSYQGDLDGDPSGYSIQTMISTFGETKMDSDCSVNNGGVLFSDALTGAMEQYGDEVKYCVIVELFSDGVAIDCASREGKAEMDRFFTDEGYTVAFENYNDGYVDHNYFTLHATLEQLENSPPASSTATA